jgi:hypothetical protein
MNQVSGTSIGKIEVFKCNQTTYKNHLYKVTIASDGCALSIKVVEIRGTAALRSTESISYFRTPSGAVEYINNMLRSTMWTFEE